MTRARRVWWSDAARVARCEMRRRGAPVDGWVDDVAARRRGHMVADGLGRMSDEMREAGLGEDTIQRTIVGAVIAIVAGEQRQQDHGPRAA